MNPTRSATPGSIIVFSASSGAGKSTLIRRVLEKMPNLSFSISATTRSRRNDEVDGRDYDFISLEEFLQGIKTGDFIEHEEVHGELYGTRKSRLEPLMAEGKDIVFDLDVLGARSLKKLYPEAFLIYIKVLSLEVLKERLVQRGREDNSEIERRLQRHVMEQKHAEAFDMVVVNDGLEEATREVAEAIRAFLDRKRP